QQQGENGDDQRHRLAFLFRFNCGFGGFRHGLPPFSSSGGRKPTEDAGHSPAFSPAQPDIDGSRAATRIRPRFGGNSILKNGVAAQSGAPSNRSGAAPALSIGQDAFEGNRRREDPRSKSPGVLAMLGQPEIISP